MKRWILSSVTAQLAGGLFAVVFCAAVMSSQITDRGGFANSELRRDVMKRWGAPILQAAPSVKAVPSGSVFKTLESLSLEQQTIRVNAEMNYRKRGLVYFSGFDFEFEGRYLVLNPRAHEIDVAFVFPISVEKNRVLLSELRFRVNGQDESIHLEGSSDHLLWTGRLEPGEQSEFIINFSGRGLDSFTYLTDPELPVRGFTLHIEVSGGDNFDYAPGVIPAASPESRADGFHLGWSFPSLESGVPVGVTLPSERSFDKVIATMARRSWVGFVLLFVWAQTLALCTSRRFAKVHEGFLVGVAYGFFFVLLPYLAAFMNFYSAYIISLLVIGCLLMLYLQRVLGLDDCKMVILALLAALFFPTLAVILEGYTGLVYTLEILVILALAMWFTTRNEFSALWSAIIATNDAGRVEHASA
jgi:hypothetical protein